MILETIALGQVLAPVVALLTATILYHYIGREYLGAEENIYWNRLRIFLLSTGDSTVRKKTNFALTNPASDDEYVGRVDLTSHELAQKLENENFVQCVLSGLKYRPPENDPNGGDVSFEAGSMAFRESKSDLLPDALASRQLHVYWFRTDDGLDLYAHEEYSSLNPVFAWQHYNAITQDPKLGEEMARGFLEKQGVTINKRA